MGVVTDFAISQLKSAPASGISAAHCPKMPPWPLTVGTGSREIVNDLI
jgi:hypothetical protein